MRTWRLPLAAAAVALALTVASAAGGKLPRSLYLEVRSTDSGASGKVTSTLKFWTTAQSSRLDISHPLSGDQRFLVFKGYAYMVVPKAKAAIKTPLPPELRVGAKGDIERMIHALPGIPDKNAKLPSKVREETLLGYKCDVLEVKASRNGQTRRVTLWMPQTLRPRIPLKIVETQIIQKKGVNLRESRELEVTKIKLNVPVTQALFQVPKGYKVTLKKPPKRPRRK